MEVSTPVVGIFILYMYTIYSSAHSIRKRTTAKGIVFDVVFRVLDENGDEHQKVLSGYQNKNLADKAYIEFTKKHCILKERDSEYKKKYIKFNDAAKSYLTYSSAMLTAATAMKRASYFELHYNYFKDKNLENIKSSDIYNWFDEVVVKPKKHGAGRYAPRTLKSIWEELYAFFAWCSSRYNVRNLMNNIKKPPLKSAPMEMQFWEISQFNKFIECVDDVFWKTFFLFQYYTGCRIGETLALSENDLKDGNIKITKSLSKKNLNNERYEIRSTKNFKIRSIPLPKILQEQLSIYIKWKRENGMTRKFLFCLKDDYLPHSTLRRYFNIYTDLAELPRIRIHDLRHSYVSLLIHKGVNLAVIANLIGDSLGQVTKTYGHMYETDKINAVKLLDF